MKYFAYCRKSTEDSSHQAQSIETQKRILSDFASNNDIEIVDYIIETRSAKDDGNRPEFTNMLSRFEKGEADGLLVAHIDRITRNLIEAGMVQKLNDLGIIKEVRTPDRIYSNQADFFMIGIELTSATYYSRNLSKRVKEGIATKLSKGEYSAPAPLGYKNNHGNIIPDSKTQHFIKEAFELYATGTYSVNQIAEKLYSEGFRTRRGGNKVYKSVIHRILNNPVYYGVMINRGKRYQGSFKPLISMALFNKVQFLLNGTHHTKKQKHNFLFNKYLTCEKCGCRITATLKKEKHTYYYCTNGKHNCDQHSKYLTENIIDKLISGVISDITLDQEMANLSLNMYADELKNKSLNKIGESQIIQEQIDNLKKKENRLLDMYLNQDIAKQIYESKKAEIEENLEDLNTALKNSKNNNPEITLELLEKFKNTAVSLKKMYDTGDREIKENLLKSVLWNATIENEKIGKVTYKKPFAYLEKMVKTNDFSLMRARWDSNPRSSA